MFKRLMIGLLALGLVTIFIAEAANAWSIRLRRSVAVTVVGEEVEDIGSEFTTDIFGLPADDTYGCGEVLGDVYCSDVENDITVCDYSTGYSAALV